MKITSELVGTVIPPIKVTISDRQCMNFAASVGDNNPWYFDDERPDGIVAPPMIAVSLIWPLATTYSETLKERGYAPVLRRQVHYTEYLEWRRPFRPGETLEIGGEVTAILQQAGGTHVLIRFHARDEAGETVFVETSGALFRGVRLDGEGRGAENVPEVPERCEQKEALWATPVYIDPLAAHIYDGCADLHFPIHTSRQFAHKVGLPNPIVHGTCTLAIAVREILNRECDGDPTRLRGVGCRFTGMVFPGTDISVRVVGVTTTDTRKLFFDVLSADGRKAISEGYLSVE